MTQHQEIKLNILADVEQYVSKIFQERLPKTCHFHNLKHTSTVVLACKEIGEAKKL